MIKKTIFLHLVILFSCQPHSEKMMKEYYPDGKLKCEYKLVNNKIEGDYIEYWENGNVKEYGKYLKGKREYVFVKVFSNGKTYRHYLNGKLEGWSVRNIGSQNLKTLYKSDTCIYQTLFDTITHDTLFVLQDFKSKKFYNVNKLHLISFLKDTMDVREIIFDTNGKIESYKGPLNFLTKKDSSDLDKFIPDWKKQVNEWEKKRVSANN
jgi:antitoxin component YwqK of YwqJK toxin-antitoxin module